MDAKEFLEETRRPRTVGARTKLKAIYLRHFATLRLARDLAEVLQ
jgi:hypothetical protein